MGYKVDIHVKARYFILGNVRHAPLVAAVRSAEKGRVSTCPLADDIARLAIHMYRAMAPETSAQTVLAAFLLETKEFGMEVLCLASGTKYWNNTESHRGPPPMSVIRDCHAEVLARRALRVWLSREVENPTRCLREESTGLLRLDGRLHFYTSTQPCGNACVKRWGTCTKDAGDGREIMQPHPYMKWHMAREGQIALSLKPGSMSHSCSDKIARWNVLGVQGAMLSRAFEGPLYIDTVTIGRKFARPMAMRALCCRLQEFSVLPGGYRVNHPTIMCTDVRLHEGSIGQEDKASFEHQALWWAQGESCLHLIGADFVDVVMSREAIAGGSLVRCGTVSNDPTGARVGSLAEYRFRKESVEDPRRRDARRVLLNDPKFFSQWIRKES